MKFVGIRRVENAGQILKWKYIKSKLEFVGLVNSYFAVRGVAMRNRSVVFVVRDKKILMEKLCYEGRTFYSIPGGGIEDGETPEQTAIRELKEECGLDGVIIRKLAEVYNHEITEYSFWVSVFRLVYFC